MRRVLPEAVAIMSETRVVHVHDEIEGAIYIGRRAWDGPGKWRKESPLANPFKIGRQKPNGPLVSRVQVIEQYRAWIEQQVSAGNPTIIEALLACRGKPIACWCRHDGEPRTEGNRCHGDVVVALLELYSDGELRAMEGADAG